MKTDTYRVVYKQGHIVLHSATQNKPMHVYVRMYVTHMPKHNAFAYHAGEHNVSTYSITTIIRTLVIRIANYPGSVWPFGRICREFYKTNLP